MTEQKNLSKILLALVASLFFLIWGSAYLMVGSGLGSEAATKKVGFLRSVDLSKDGYTITIDDAAAILDEICLNSTIDSVPECNLGPGERAVPVGLLQYPIRRSISFTIFDEDGKQKNYRYSPRRLGELLGLDYSLQFLPFVITINQGYVVGVEEVYDSRL